MQRELWYMHRHGTVMQMEVNVYATDLVSELSPKHQCIAMYGELM
jgi:hypothetical protein